MTGGAEPPGTAVFVPSIGRYMLSEFWGFMLSVCVLAVAAYFWGSMNLSRVLSLGASLLIGIAFGAAFRRRSRRLAIGDSWITGPIRGSSEPTTITFNAVDLPNSGFRRGALLIQAVDGRRIKTKMNWYSPDDAEKIRRLARDRCGISPQPE